MKRQARVTRLTSSRGVFLSLFVLAAFSTQAEEQSDGPASWLARMNSAFETVDYDGVFSYFAGSDLATLRVVHKVVDGVQRERLVHLNGAHREILREGDRVSCWVMPDDQLLALEASIPAGPFARAFVREFDSMSDHYSVALDGEDRVAGRQAYRLALKPTDEHRFGYKLWLDAENALLLRSELLGTKGERLEIFQFTQIAFGDAVADAALQVEHHDGQMETELKLVQKTAPASEQKSPWSAGWLPPGFAMTAADLRRTPEQEKMVHTLMYSDGIAAFSVFVEEMPNQGAGAMHMRKGATVTVNTRVKDAQGKDYLVTVVGELPDATAQLIAQGVRSS